MVWGVDTSSIITCSCHYDCFMVGIFQSLTFGLAISITTERKIENRGSVVHCVVNTFVSRTVTLHHRDRHDERLGVGAYDTFIIGCPI